MTDGLGAWWRALCKADFRSALPISLLLHAGILLAYLIVAVPTPPPLALPNIELLPPIALPDVSAEAKPNPADAPIRNIAVKASEATPTPLPQLPPLITSNAVKAEMTPLRSGHKPMQKKTAALPQPDLQVKTDEKNTQTVEAAALPTSGRSDEQVTFLADKSGPVHAGPPPTYIGLIRAKLEHEKHYPRTARLDGVEGVVLLRFSLERSGALLDWRIDQGAGSAALDEEVGRMVRQAAPFPPFPDGLDKEHLTLIVPVEFSLASAKPGD